MPLEDLERASKLLIQALDIRKRYMNMSHQSFSSTAARFLDPDKEQQQHDEKQTIEGMFFWKYYKYRKNMFISKKYILIVNFST